MKAIFCINQDGALGISNALIYHFKNDLIQFKQKTLYSSVLMGTKTFLSLDNPLPNRKNIIIGTSVQETPGITVYQTKEELLKNENINDVWLIGGAQIFDLFFDYITEIHLTVVKDSNKDFSVSLDYEKIKNNFNVFSELRTSEVNLLDGKIYKIKYQILKHKETWT